jgi:hypothetical protein
MLNNLGEQIALVLGRHQVCLLSTNGAGGVWAIPVRYRSQGLEVVCLAPRWADAAFYLEQDPRLLLIVPDRPPLPAGKGEPVGELRWLQYRGNAELLASPNWAELLPEDVSRSPPGDRYLAIHVKPWRIDLIDESQGWGVLETLEI